MALFPLALPAARSSQLQIAAIAAEAHGKVSVACSAPGLALDCDLNAHAHPPMQSVFKLPLAFTALHLVEQGKFSLDQPIRFLPGDRILPHTYSPLQDEYPNGGVDVSLRRLLQLSVSFSDNVAADIVLRAIGGPAVVRRYINACGIDGFRIEDGEAALHRDEKRQYRNWFEPAAAVKFLRMLNDNPPLSREHAALLMEWMRTGVRGAQRMPGRLPAGTVTMHKPGTSSIENGMAAATNDIGLIVLPGGRRLALAVFLTDSTADEATRELVIARIARAVYDAAVREIANRAALEVMRRDHLEAVTVALEVSTGTVVVSTASDPANLDVETPVLPLSLMKVLLAASWWDRKQPEDAFPIGGMIAIGRDADGRTAAVALRKAVGTEAVVADFSRYRFDWGQDLRPLDDADWSDVLSIGEHHVMTTAAAVARFFQGVGNGGMRCAEGAGGVCESPARMLDATTAEKLMAAMRETVRRGSAQRIGHALDDLHWSIGGKTGTGGVPKAPIEEQHGWFAGLIFDREGKARFSVATYVANGGLGAGHAADVCVAVARALGQ